jgi:hypothetical protein
VIRFRGPLTVSPGLVQKAKPASTGVIGCRDPVSEARSGPLARTFDRRRRLASFFVETVADESPRGPPARSLAPHGRIATKSAKGLGPGSTSAARIRRTTPGSALVGRRLSCQATTHPDRQEPGPPRPRIGPRRRRRLWFLPSLDPGAAGGHKKCTRRTFFPAETGLRLNGCRGEVICRRRGLATPRTDKTSRSRRSFRVSIVVLA